jgi:hypothetical protein
MTKQTIVSLIEKASRLYEQEGNPALAATVLEANSRTPVGRLESRQPYLNLGFQPIQQTPIIRAVRKSSAESRRKPRVATACPTPS